MAWMREAIEAGGGIAPAAFPDWSGSLLHLRDLFLLQQKPMAEDGWRHWAAEFSRVEADLHYGTAGWADSTFYAREYAFLDREHAPDVPRAVADFSHGLATWDWAEAAAAADVLLGAPRGGDSWVEPGRLMDGAVFAHIRTGRPDAARDALMNLRDRTGRARRNIRTGLLEALVEEAARSH
jgi:hypothetical protein